MLQTTLAGITLNNPTVLASGILGISKEYASTIAKAGAGALTLKSLCHEERVGHPGPNMIVIENGMLNAVGLPGQGIDNATNDFERLDDLSVPVFGSIFGYSVEHFGEVAKKMAALNPALIEVDVSCPSMSYGDSFFSDPDLLAQVTKIVKKNAGKIPISIKLSPQVPDIGSLAKICEKNGADAITAINTASGMSINIDARKPVLGNKIGGLSGPALKPIAVRCVYEIYDAVKIPIIGTGGVSNGKDAIEMIMAGATAVGMGTAIYYNGPQVFSNVCKEIEQWLKTNKVTLNDITGAAH